MIIMGTYKSHLTYKKTLLTLRNKGRYGKDFKEALIGYSRGYFNIEVTDGYNCINISQAKTLKEAVKISKNILLNNKE